MTQHEFCPRQYYLARYLEWPAASTGEDFTGPGTGSTVHRILAGMPVRDPSEEALGLADIWKLSDIAGEAAGAVRVEREFDFLVEVEGWILSGQIDLWFEHDGVVTVVDYKSDEAFDPNRYTLQVQLYALVLEKVTGRRVTRGVLFELRSGVAHEVDLSDSGLARAREALQRLRDAQERQSFPLNEGLHCTKCRYFGGACPAEVALTAIDV